MLLEKIDIPESERCAAGQSVMRQVVMFCGLLLLSILLTACVSAEHCRNVLAASAATKAADARQASKDKTARASTAATQTRPATDTDTAAGEDAARAAASRIAAELARACPRAAPDSLAAFEACRKALTGASVFRDALSDRTLWGPQSNDLSKGLKESGLTRVAPDTLAGLFMPLFMFTGKHSLAWSENEKLWRLELAASFRSRLQHDQLPAPYQHQEETWRLFERTSTVLLWIDPSTTRITYAQVSERGRRPQSFALEPRSKETAEGGAGQLETSLRPRHAEPPGSPSAQPSSAAN